MGQAKQRGTFEQRRLEAQQAEALRMEQRRVQIEAAKAADRQRRAAQPPAAAGAPRGGSHSAFGRRHHRLPALGLAVALATAITGVKP